MIDHFGVWLEGVCGCGGWVCVDLDSDLSAWGGTKDEARVLASQLDGYVKPLGPDADDRVVFFDGGPLASDASRLCNFGPPCDSKGAYPR
jgi:hypothetical protein